MGDCMAMHLASRNHQDVAEVFALSSFLNKSSAVYQVSFRFLKNVKYSHVETKTKAISNDS